MVLPPGPINLPILSGSMRTVMSRGAYWLSSSRGAGMAPSMASISSSDLLWPGKDGFDFVEPQAAGLEVKLNTSDAVAGTGHLEVHLAEEVFFANDVGDVGDGAIGRSEPAHRDARRWR